MKYILILLCICFLFACNNTKEPPVVKLVDTFPPVDTFSRPMFEVYTPNKNDTPHKPVNGNIIAAQDWLDTEGKHSVMLIEEEGMNGELPFKKLHAFCFVKNGNEWQQQWKVQDGVGDCEVDITAEFFPGSLTVTDINNNGVGEVTFLYRTSCKGDVSPDTKKLIMYQGANKYAIRGTTALLIQGHKDGATKNIDPSFADVPKSLLDYANKQWDAFGTVTY